MCRRQGRRLTPTLVRPIDMQVMAVQDDISHLTFDRLRRRVTRARTSVAPPPANGTGPPRADPSARLRKDCMLGLGADLCDGTSAGQGGRCAVRARAHLRRGGEVRHPASGTGQSEKRQTRGLALVAVFALKSGNERRRARAGAWASFSGVRQAGATGNRRTSGRRRSPHARPACPGGCCRAPSPARPCTRARGGARTRRGS